MAILGGTRHYITVSRWSHWRLPADCDHICCSSWRQEDERVPSHLRQGLPGGLRRGRGIRNRRGSARESQAAPSGECAKDDSAPPRTKSVDTWHAPVRIVRFYFWRLYSSASKFMKAVFVKIILMDRTCWSQSLFSVIIQRPLEKIYWLFVEGVRVMLTSGLAHKNMSSP